MTDQAVETRVASTPSRPPSDGAMAKRERPRSRRWMTVLAPVVIFAAVAGMFAAALQKGDPTRVPSALIGRPVPQFELPAIPGLMRAKVPLKGLSSADFGNGHPAVVNFWASWCQPCVEEHPQLVELAERTGIALYGINQKDQTANALRFLERYGNPFVAVGADVNGRAAIEWGVYGTPETFVVDGKGTVVYKHVGPISAEALRTKLLPAIAAARSEVKR